MMGATVKHFWPITKEVCTMNLKDAFRLQNKLKNLMYEATSIL